MFRRLLHYWDQTSLYLERKVFYAAYGIAAIFVLSFFLPVLEAVAFFLLLALAILVVVDALLLYQKRGLSAERFLQDRFSNGDENKIVLRFRNAYPFKITAAIIDELPYQFQERNWKREITVDGNTSAELLYSLTPTERGEYGFGRINAYVEGRFTW